MGKSEFNHQSGCGVKKIIDFAYVGRSFSESNSSLDVFLNETNDVETKIDQWVRENPIRHQINSWVLNRLAKSPQQKIIEIGGGDSYFSQYLASRYAYNNIDLFVHGRRSGEKLPWMIESDWRDYRFVQDSVVLSLDLFPNVDQGLPQFLENTTHVPELILSLTCFKSGRHYRAKRLDGDEMLTLVAWNLKTLRNSISDFVSNPEIIQANLEEVSAFSNSRDVYLVHLVNE